MTSGLFFDNVVVPKEHVLPGVVGLKGPLSCLTQARYGIAWGVIGAAQACLKTVLDYTATRVLFGRPLAQNQTIQVRLAEMARRITTAQLLALQLGRMKDAGTLQPAHVSLAKWNNCRMALDVARDCRDMLGGAGISRRVRPDPPHAQPRECHHLRGHRDDPPAHHRPHAHRAERLLEGSAAPCGARDPGAGVPARAGAAQQPSASRAASASQLRKVARRPSGWCAAADCMDMEALLQCCLGSIARRGGGAAGANMAPRRRIVALCGSRPRAFTPCWQAVA